MPSHPQALFTCLLTILLAWASPAAAVGAAASVQTTLGGSGWAGPSDADPVRAEMEHALIGGDANGTYSFAGHASAGLASGALHAGLSIVTAGFREGATLASASLSDTLSFAWPNAAGPREVLLQMQVDGSFLAQTGTLQSASASLNLNSAAGLGFAWTSAQWSPGMAAAAISKSGDVDILSNAPSFVNLVLNVRVPVFRGFPVSLNADLLLQQMLGDADIATVDFGHTAQLALVLPADMQFSSASGLFLSAVPEPGAGSLMVLGLFSCLAMRPMRRCGPACGRPDAPRPPSR